MEQDNKFSCVAMKIRYYLRLYQGHSKILDAKSRLFQSPINLINLGKYCYSNFDSKTVIYYEIERAFKKIFKKPWLKKAMFKVTDLWNLNCKLLSHFYKPECFLRQPLLTFVFVIVFWHRK